MSRIHKETFFLILIFCLPITYILGIATTEVFAFIISLFFFYKIKDVQLYKIKIFLFLFIFSIYIFFNGYFQIHDNLKYSSFFYFRYLILSISIFYILNSFKVFKENIRTNLLRLIFIFIILIILDSFLQFFVGENILGDKIINGRVSSFFGSELVLGSFLIKILPFLIWIIFYFRFDTQKNKYFLIIFFSSIFFTIYISAERTSFALMLFIVILCLIFLDGLKKIFINSFIVFLFSVLIIYTFDLGKSNPSPHNRIFIKTFNQITNNFFLKKKDKININKNDLKKNLKIFSDDHQGHYLLAYNLFKQNIFFGTGPKGFRYYCRKEKYDSEIGICSTHPHNTTMQIMSELGLVGLFFYIYFLMFVILNIFLTKKKKFLDINKKNSLFIISIAILINLFPFLPSGNFFNNWICIINYFYIGIYCYNYKKIF